MASEIERTRRVSYRRFETIGTRWMDNDAYGHVNNAVYYSWFDTVVNRVLVQAGLLDIVQGPTIALVVETGCRYFVSSAFPDVITAGVRVDHLGTSSVRYEIALFRNDDDQAAAVGFFIHVYVDRDTRRPVGIDAATRNFLQTLTI